MEKRYVIIGEEGNSFSKPMSKQEAIKKVKEYNEQGISSYIVTENEAKRIKESGKFNKPTWS